MSFAKCHYAQYRYSDCHYAECQYAECQYAECHYAEYCYAECSAPELTFSNWLNNFGNNQSISSSFSAELDSVLSCKH